MACFEFRITDVAIGPNPIMHAIFFSTSPCTPKVEGTVDDLDPFVFVHDEDYGVGIFRNGGHSFFFDLGGQ